MVKVVFFGSGHFVNPVIEVIKKNFDLVQVVTPQSELSEKADVGVIASYGKIVSKNVIDSFSHGIINIHPSLLPKYRGPTPVQTAILSGDKKTGVTIIKIDEQVDHGPILGQREVEISDKDTSETLLAKLFEIGAEMLLNVISNYISSKGRSASGRKEQINLSPQDDSRATFTQHLSKQSGFISLQNPPPPEKLERMTRAFYPWPGVWTRFNGKIVKLLPNDMIQVEGRKPMSYKDFVNGYPNGSAFLKKLRVF